MEEFRKKLFLIDAMGLIYRAYYALNKQPRINSKGKNTSAALGFTNSLYEIIKKEKPTHIGVAFDSFSPNLRNVEFSDYKANRESTPEDIVNCLPDIKKIIKGFGIPLLEVPGYEADDIIGTVAKRAEKFGFDVYMVTMDKDYGQLVSDHIFMYKLAHSGYGVSILGVPEICKKYSIKYPEQLIDILGLWGDSSDNIPGIKGVGEVTSKYLINKFGSIESMIENLSQVDSEKLRLKIKEGAEMALKSKKLATIITDVPLDLNEADFRSKLPDFSILKPVLEDLEFKTLLKRIVTDHIPKEETQISFISELFWGEKPGNIKSSFKNIYNTDHNYVLINNYEDVLKLSSKFAEVSEFCFDTETESLNLQDVKIVGISFCAREGEAYYISIPESQEVANTWLSAFQPVFADEKVLKIAQNLKFDLQVLRHYGINVKGRCFDTMLAHYLLEPEQKHNMDQLALQYLAYETISYSQMLEKQSNIREVIVERLKDYASEDADITYRLYKVFKPMLQEKNAWELFEKIEMPLVDVLASMEQKGVHIDVDYLKKYSSELQEKAQNTESEIYKLSGEKFNIASPKQLGVILFEKLKIVENAKLTKTKQYQTGEEVLKKLVNKHPVVPLILEYRRLQKLRSTYTEAFPQLVSPITNRVHTSFNQAITATGRLSSSNPNLQNIPIRNEEGKEIRKAFIPANKAYLLLSADYSQIELRIMASMSGDESLIEAFNEGLDIHASTAAKIYNVPLKEVTVGMRRSAKAVNFGIIYGMSAFGLAERLNISRRESSEMITQYFAKYPKIKLFMESQKEYAKVHGYVETICNRRRYLPDIFSKNSIVRGVAERNAINAPIQGSAADLIKIAMINVHNKLKSSGFKSAIVLQVHDELVLDVYKPELDYVYKIVKDSMENAMTLSVPLVVDIQAGENWLEAH